MGHGGHARLRAPRPSLSYRRCSTRSAGRSGVTLGFRSAGPGRRCPAERRRRPTVRGTLPRPTTKFEQRPPTTGGSPDFDQDQSRTPDSGVLGRETQLVGYQESGRRRMGPAGFEPEPIHSLRSLVAGSESGGNARHCSLSFAERVGPAGFEPKADVLASLRATARVRIRSASHTRSLRSRCSMGPAGFEPAIARCPIPRARRPIITDGNMSRVL